MDNEVKQNSMRPHRVRGYGRLRVFPATRLGQFLVVAPHLATVVSASGFFSLLHAVRDARRATR